MKTTRMSRAARLLLVTMLILGECACAHTERHAQDDFSGTWEGTSSMLLVVEDPSRKNSNSHELFFERLVIARPRDGKTAHLVLGLDASCKIEGVLDGEGELEFSPQTCIDQDAHLTSEMLIWGEASLDGEDEIEIFLDGTVTYKDEDAMQDVSARLRYHFRGSRH